MLITLLLELILFRELYYYACSRASRVAKQIVRNNQCIYKELQSIAESDHFSKIQIDIGSKGSIRTQKCPAGSCAIRKLDFDGSKNIIDLLQMSEAYPMHTAVEMANIWPELHMVAERDTYTSCLLNGIQLLIIIHMAVFQEAHIGWIIPNMSMLEPAHEKYHRNNLEELYTVYRAAMAVLPYNQDNMPSSVLRLSTKLIKQNMKQLGEREHGRVLPYVQSLLDIQDENYIGRLYIKPSMLPLFGELIGLLGGFKCQRIALLGIIQINGLMAAVKALNNRPLSELELIYLVNAFRRASVGIEECSRLIDSRFVMLKFPPAFFIECLLINIGLLCYLLLLPFV